jgi:acetyltransferase-like isoleucine patch superfamily enzyme
MIYGYNDLPSGQWRKWTRISSSAVLMNRPALSMGDHIWVWHYSILDATAGLTIEQGCQIGAWVGIFTHGSQNAIRLLGEQFVHIPNQERSGYTRGTVHIGAYSFIAAGAKILPGVTLGKGCLVGAESLVTKDLPDYAIAVGSPAQIKGSTLDLDLDFFRHQDFSATYYDPVALSLIRQKLSEETPQP